MVLTFRTEGKPEGSGSMADAVSEAIPTELQGLGWFSEGWRILKRVLIVT